MSVIRAGYLEVRIWMWRRNGGECALRQLGYGSGGWRRGDSGRSLLRGLLLTCAHGVGTRGGARDSEITDYLRFDVSLG